MFKIASLFSKKKEVAPFQHAHDAWFCKSLEECADGLWDWNLGTGELYISPKLRELIGYNEEETRNQSPQRWLERIHPEDQAEIQRIIKEVYDSQREFIYFDAFRLLCKNGDYLWLENHAAVLRGANNAPIRIAGMTINITPQKYIQNQLYTIISDQEKEAKSKMRFLSALSHEFRSPLSGIIGMLTLLKETILSTDQSHYVENISNSTEMLLTLVNDILDVTKLNSGKFEFEVISFSPSRVINKAIDLIRPSIMKKNLNFNALISTEIPEYLKGDPTRLQQILVNILSNATKFTSKGGISILVKKIQSPLANSLPAKHILHFEIADTGIGIAPEVHEQLFEDFTQAHSSIARMYGGTGLGLSICKELVHLMGGEIGVRSELGRGSTFWFSLPFEEEVNLSNTEILSPGGALKPLPKSKLNVLLVEDNQVNQEVMSGLLNLLGDDVTITNNGQEAVDVFQQHRFDIVLMDLNLPVLDGLSATQAIRKLPHGDIPIIAITANTFSGEQQNCLNYGITQVLTKPIDKVTLEMALLPHRSSGNPISITPNIHKAIDLQPMILDHRAINNLITDLGKDKVIKLLDMYRIDALSLVKQMRESTLQERHSYAHTLAGMSDNLGIVSVGKSARAIMDAGNSDSQSLHPLIEDLEHQFENSTREIQNLLQTNDMETR